MVRTTFGDITFVHDKAKPNPGSWSFDALVANVKKEMQDVDENKTIYSAWEDNHDGYGVNFAAGMGPMDLARAFSLSYGQFYAAQVRLEPAAIACALLRAAWGSPERETAAERASAQTSAGLRPEGLPEGV